MNLDPWEGSPVQRKHVALSRVLARRVVTSTSRVAMIYLIICFRQNTKHNKHNLRRPRLVGPRMVKFGRHPLGPAVPAPILRVPAKIGPNLADFVQARSIRAECGQIWLSSAEHWPRNPDGFGRKQGGFGRFGAKFGRLQVKFGRIWLICG